MQRFSCETIQRWPGGTLRSLSIVGRWVFIPLGVAVAKALGRGADGHLFLLYIPIALLFAPYVIWELRSRVHTGGHLEVSEGRMRLSAPEVIVRLEQVIGIYAAEEGTLVIQLLDGTKIEVVLEEDWPDEVMRAFGFDASRRALVAPLRGQIGSFTAGLVAFVGVMVIASVAFTRLLGDGGIVVALALAGMAGWWVGRRVGARRVVVERDGVRLVGALGERFVPRSEIVGVEVVRGLLSEEAIAHFGLDMVLRSGKRVRLDLLMQSKPQRDALRTMIEKGPSATKVTSTAPEASSGEYAA